MNGRKVATRPLDEFGRVQFFAAALAILSASSFHVFPVCPGIQSIFTFIPFLLIFVNVV